MRDFEREYGKYVKETTPEYWDKLSEKICVLPCSEENDRNKVVSMSDYKKSKEKKKHSFSASHIRLLVACFTLCAGLCAVMIGGYDLLGGVSMGGQKTLDDMGQGNADYNAIVPDVFAGGDISSSSSSRSTKDDKSTGSSWSMGGFLSGGSSDKSDDRGSGFSLFTSPSSREKSSRSETPEHAVVDDSVAPESVVPSESESESDVFSEREVSGDSYFEDAGDDDVYYDYGDYYKSDVVSDNPRANVLTAGRWNDNDNWSFFQSLVAKSLVDFPSFGIDPTNRVKVTVTCDNGAPAYNQLIRLYNVSTGVDAWRGRTNAEGVVYLFGLKGEYEYVVEVGGVTEKVKPVNLQYDQTVSQSDNQYASSSDMYDWYNSGSNIQETQSYPYRIVYDFVGYEDMNISIPADVSRATGYQIMFIVDTTGSMDDELSYLKRDFVKITQDVDTDQGYMAYSVNFYRDQGDEYVILCHPFSTNVTTVSSILDSETSAGGGDEPEAVADILEATITQNDEWKENTTKVAFLIFDAPPHRGTELTLQTAVRQAAAKGIHLIPVVCSTGNRDTELFGRALAICTDGEYVFLTDDSGVGGSHMEPIIGDYKVQSLHDIIVDIIRSYQR